MANSYALGYGGRLDPRIIPLVIIAIIAFKRNAIAEKIACWIPFPISSRQLSWGTLLGMGLIYGITCWLYATYASGSWTWSPGVVFVCIEVLRLFFDDVSQSLLGEPFDK